MHKEKLIDTKRFIIKSYYHMQVNLKDPQQNKIEYLPYGTNNRTDFYG